MYMEIHAHCTLALGKQKENQGKVTHPTMYMYVQRKCIHVHCRHAGCCRYFRTEESKESVLVIPVGNVTAQTELTYEYGARKTARKPSTKKPSKKGVLYLQYIVVYKYI